MFAKIKNFIIKLSHLNHSNSLKNFLALCLGVLLDLAFAPFNCFLFAIISLSAFFLIIDKLSDLKQVFVRSFFYCFGFFVFGIYWICNSLLIDIAKYAWLIPFAITLIPALMAVYFAFIVYIYKLLIIHFSISFTYKKIIIFSLGFLIFDIVRSNLFTGFSWNLLGYIWLFNIQMAQSASLVGVYGLTLFASLISLTPCLFISHKKNSPQNWKNYFFAFILIKIFLVNYFFGYKNINQEYQNNLPQLAKLRLVQTNILQKDKWLEEEKYQNLKTHIELTKSKPLDNIDAVIWSETSIPFVIDQNNLSILQSINNAIPPQGFLLSGAIRVARDTNKYGYKVWNSAFVLEKNGIKAFYDKQHLVPFGEYVPLHQYFSFLFIDDVVDKITGGGVGFSSGEGKKLINLPKFSFNPLLCYEVIFSREIVDKDSSIPDLFVNLTNDAWFGVSSGPYQHLQMARMRAIEYARPLVRVAQTGISANINHFGEVVDKIGLNEVGVIDVEIYKNQKNSVYAKYSHLPLIIISFFLVILVLIKFPDFKRRK
ncbi:MAG: apolipoprotein N-acyltransferase [Proteobacteria bacterium]|nr:apolipoprotein N-acyltransferase [Pseudomonadota bacterium]